jgi:hypothetical protein
MATALESLVAAAAAVAASECLDVLADCPQ